MDRRVYWSELGFRPVLFPAVCFAGGACLWAERPEHAWLFLLAALALGVGSALLSPRTGSHLALLLACAGAGAGLSGLASRTVVPEALRERKQVVLEGEVAEVTRIEDSTRVELQVSRADGAPARVGARLYARGAPPHLFVGQRIVVPARLKPLASVSNPGEADFRSRLVRRGLVFSGGADPRRIVALTPPSAYRMFLARTHRDLQAKVETLAPSKEAAALYLTLAAGLRAELGDELEERFSRSGLAHVLSVSGLHVAVLAVALLKVLRWLLSGLLRRARRFDVRRLAAPCAIPLVWAYVLFTGNQMPAVRSAIMATAVLVAMALWRRADGLNALAFALLVVVAFDPSAVLDLSVQLSFLAVASLIVLTPALRELLPIAPPDPHQRPYWRYRVAKVRESVLSTFCASIAVTLTGAPLVAAAFGRLSLAGLLSNVVTLPLCGALTLLAAGGAFAFVLAPPLAVPLLWLGGWGSELLLRIATFFAAVPGASVKVRAFGAAATALWLLGWFAWALLRQRRRWTALAMAPAALLLSFAVPALLPQPGMSVTFLAVGQGDAIVVRSGGKTLVVDGGGVPGGADTAQRFVLPWFRHVGVEEVDLAVLSHPHPDHALGLISILQKVPTRRLWVPAGDEGGELGLQVIAAAGDAQVEEIEAGHAPFSLGEATVEVLGPPADRLLLEGVNDRSVVLRIRHRGVTVLLPGDVEAAGEALLDPGPVTVLKVPHHGSSTSSSDAFVARVRPKFAVFCVGAHNRFGFPDQEVEGRYRAVGAACYRTDQHGAITLESDGSQVRVRTFLEATERASPPHVAQAAGDEQPFRDDP